MTAAVLDTTTAPAGDLERLRSEHARARKALRRAGCFAVANPDIPLDEAIDRMAADFRAVLDRERDEIARLRTALKDGTPLENPNRPEEAP